MASVLTLENKFRSVGLGEADRAPLLQLIAEEEDATTLSSLLYMWGYTFPEESSVRAVCLRHIEIPSPGLTATCLKLVCDYWGQWREYERELSRYLDPAIYDEWYDEVIVAFSFVSRHPYGWSLETLTKYANVNREAERLGLTDFQ